MKKSIISVLLVFAVFAFLVSCGGSEGSGSGGSGSNDSGEPGSIYGIVTDKATGEQIINAGVELQPVGLKTVTGSDGQFEFNEVATGTYTLFVTKTGYSESSSSITVESGKQAKGDVQLEKLPAALRIVDDDGKDISELDFGEKLADVSRQFNIFNDGYEKLEWEISFSADWITSLSKESGELKEGGTQGVIVNIDRSLLESGENTTTIHVTSNDGNKQLTVKATNATVLPTLNTLETTNITSSTAVLNAEILTSGVPSYSERGFVYALESNPTLENTIAQLTAKVTEENLYSATVTGLELGEEYYVRGYAINEAGVAYSTNEVKFSPEMDLPNVTTEEATNINLDSESATFNGTIVDEGDPAYTERGFVYGFTHNPSVDNTKIEVIGSGLGKFSANVTELEVGSIYYIRAYAINNKGVAYGSDVMLDLNGTVPQVKTEPATDLNIGAGTAIFHGEIEYLGDPIYSERGFVYNINHNPTTDDSKVVVSGTSEGEYSSDVDGLVVGNIYYVRAFATNAQGTAYGEEVEVDFGELKPQVTTGAATNKNLAAGTATLNGTIVSVGDPAYTERGFVYATVHNPTVEENADTKKVVPGTDSGAFSINVSGLVLNTLYYVRAYATNSQGTVYGEEKELDMTGTLPVVTTAAVSGISIESGTATFKGTIEELGDPAYTERGFVYGLTHSPTIDDTKKVVSGTGTGTFSANVTGLSVNKIYYVRAYATNVEGTVYGTEVSADFTAIMPVVNTSVATSINLTAGTATLNGKINSIGDPAYTERGFAYGTIHNPTIEDNTKKVAPGSGTGDFSANISGLVLNTTYYIRAYAKSSQGTAYGSEITLNFKGTLATVNTSAATNISIASRIATFNGSIENVGNPEYTERGFVYGLTHNPNIVDDTKKTALGSGTGAFSASVTNLEMNKTYYIRAYATNLQGTAYGNEVTLNFNAVPAAVTTNSVSNIDATTATLNGNITAIGDPAYTEKGFVYSLTPNPTTSNSKVKVSGSGSGTFTYNLTGLETQVTYYVKAYVISNNNVRYGSEISFFTESPYYYMLSGGLIVAKEDPSTNKQKWDSAVTLCKNSTLAGFTDWRLPTQEELVNVYNNKNAIGNFRSFVYWSYSTYQGNENRAWALDFSDGRLGYVDKTDSIYVRCVRSLTAVFETNSAVNVDLTKATLSGNILSAGDPAYTEKGFVYGKSPNPTTSDNKVKVSGSGAGTFTYNLTNLETRVTYYVRSYVISNNNLIYGNEVSFYTESPDYFILQNEGNLMVARADAGTACINDAATLCSSSRLGGYSNWRLPTITELVTIYNNKDSIGNFTNGAYWSSTLFDNDSRYKQTVNFNNGSLGYTDWANGCGTHVRCVRK